MSQAEFKTICVLGRQPTLGLAELESLYGAEAVRPAGEHSALLNVDPQSVNFQRLGGVIKTAKVLAVLPTTKWPGLLDYLRKNVPAHLTHLPEGRLTLGLSVYGLDVGVQQVNKDTLKLKKLIQETGRPVRVVPNKTLELNSAQVLHNKLTSRGGWELVLIKDGAKTILAQTLFVQDIEAYAARDQARPARDARVGMLPPKLAQIMINLAVGPLERKLQSNAHLDGAQGEDEQQNEPYKQYGERVAQSSTQRSAKTSGGATGLASRQAARLRVRVLDPFCGSGVILQESLLMGYSVLGTDIDERMVNYTKTNVEWLIGKNPQIQGLAVIEPADATYAHWPGFSAIASEVYLGRPLPVLPAPDRLQPIINDVNTIIKKFLVNLAGQIKPGRRVCLAVPAWRKPGGQLIRLPLLENLTDMGYNILDFSHAANQDFIYFRENQVVARQLLVLVKK